MNSSTRGPDHLRLILAFFVLYVIWGSTYLAIRFAIETLPGFLMAGVRFSAAGAILYAWARLSRRADPPTLRHWTSALVMGVLMLAGGNGAVVWAEERVPSGLVALLVATVPIWMVLLDWLQGTGGRPTRALVAGMVLGFAGVGVLVAPDILGGSTLVDPVRAGVVVLGSLSWAAGSIYARRAILPASPFLATALQMLSGGAALLAMGVARGELATVDLSAASTRSLLALLYLVLFGSILAYSAYIWLLRVSTPARVGTYAYVNPVVAVILGWAFAGEPVTGRVFLSGAIIVVGVALITAARMRPGRKPVSGSTGDGPPDVASRRAAPAPPKIPL